MTAKQISYESEAREQHASSDIAGTFHNASRWLEENAGQPFFVLIHTYEAHMPYSNHDFIEGMDPEVTKKVQDAIKALEELELP